MSKFQQAIDDVQARKKLIDELTMGYDWNWDLSRPLPPPEKRRTRIKPEPKPWVMKNYE